MHRGIAIVLFFLTLSLYPFLFIAIKLTSPGPFIFKQKRMGKGKKVFIIYKLRTMVRNAERVKHRYKKFNEADGPVFKIKNDPRYTSVGKLLAKSALDEIPQLVNIIKGEMAFVGPRPLPVDEAGKVPRKYDGRFSILPGLTSSWVTEGGHKLTFDQWMRLDCKYAKTKNLATDITIIFRTITLILGNLAK